MDILDRFALIIRETERPVVLEFGACDGYHTNRMLDALKGSACEFVFHAFEPCRTLLESVQRNTASHAGTFSIWNAAIGAVDGITPLFVSGGERIVDGEIVDHYYGSSSIRRPKRAADIWKGMTFTVDQTVVMRLDTFAAQHLGDGAVDFVWADIQGAEIDLIQGGRETLRRTRYLYTEYAETEFYEGEIGLAAICELLPEFQIVEQYEHDVLLRNTRWA